MSITSQPALAITGSTGFVGGHLARLVADAGVPQRLLVRNQSKAPVLPGSVIHPASYADRDAAVSALQGVQTLFMVSAAESVDRLAEHRAFIDAAAQAGVAHVVYTSFLAAAPDAEFTLARDHWHTEQYIEASGMAWTFLRDNFYQDFVSGLGGEDGVIRGPAGGGRCSFVARTDVARSAFAVLQDPARHAGRTYAITGPEALSFRDVARLLTQIGGSEVVFHDESVEEAYESRKKWPAPDWQYDAWVSTYTAIASGALAEMSGDVELLTGRPPVTLAETIAADRSIPS